MGGTGRATSTPRNSVAETPEGTAGEAATAGATWEWKVVSFPGLQQRPLQVTSPGLQPDRCGLRSGRVKQWV